MKNLFVYGSILVFLGLLGMAVALYYDPNILTPHTDNSVAVVDVVPGQSTTTQPLTDEQLAVAIQFKSVLGEARAYSTFAAAFHEELKAVTITQLETAAQDRFETAKPLFEKLVNQPGVPTDTQLNAINRAGLVAYRKVAATLVETYKPQLSAESQKACDEHLAQVDAKLAE